MLQHKTFKTLTSWALSKSSVHITLILVFGIIGYANTFHVPFFFDDNRVIVENYLIKNLGNLWPPSGTRWLGVLTFALNYSIGGLNVTGYHIVNQAIHLSASLLVYRFVQLTFRTPLFFSGEQSAVNGQLTALAAAVLFVAHPIQTQAVTYIVQRFASLATLLFLASILCYIHARLSYVKGNISASSNLRSTVIWYIASLLCAVLAMKTKEIALTLPFVIIIYEFTFYPRYKLTERLYFLIPVALTLLVIPLTLLSVSSEGISIASSASDISRHDYLLTQFRVIVTYLRLLILPVNQMMDYVYPVSKVFFDPAVFLSFLLLSALFVASILLLCSGEHKNNFQKLRIIGFGGLWFFITLSVESSVIPITDVIFEHRLYLPAVGVFMVFATAGSIIVERVGKRYPGSIACLYSIVVCLLCILPVATYLRNEVWQSEITLWEDVANKSPDNARARAIIGIKHIEAKNIDMAIARFQEAIRIKPDYADAIICLGNAYIAKGMLDEGNQQYLKALVLGTMDFESRAGLMMNMGNYNLKIRMYDRAIYYYQNALSVMPNEAIIHKNLGNAYKAKGLTKEAEVEFARAKQLNPDKY